MSDRYFKILRESIHKVNYIPSGQQLPRTPPLTDVKKQLDFSCKKPEENVQSDTGDQNDHDQNRTFDFSTREIKIENLSEADDPSSMLKGMKGYQLTPGDLDFIKKMKEEKLFKKYHGDLEEVRRLLTMETIALEVLCDMREKAQAELDKFPSREELRQWVEMVLQSTSPSTELTNLDTKSLVAMITKGNIQKAMEEKQIQLAQLEKRNKEAEERSRRIKQIAKEELKIQELTNQLSDLMSELAQKEEAYKSLQVQIKMEEDNQEENTSAKQQAKGRKKAVKSTEKLLRSKCTDRKTDEQLDSQESQARRRKPPRTTKSAAAQQKNKPEVKTEVQSAPQQVAPSRSRRKAAVRAEDAVEEAQHAGLRRSKRIASRR